jgi:hypothetical protein
MKKLALFALIQLLISGLYLDAQKMVLKSGNLDFIKGQKSLLVKYDYSNMSVGKYDKEDDYIKEKVAEGNSAEAGKGDKWKSEWFSKRANAYEPAFEELFNKVMDKEGLVCSQTAKDAVYGITVHTVSTDVGYYIGISSKPSYIDAEIIFTKASSAEKLAVISVEKCPGVGGIKESYAKLGKSLAGFLLKKM